MKSPLKGKKKERAVTDSESDSEFQTQGFEPRDSDPERLWDVIAIRGERKGMYLIQWAGADKNGKPWTDSWVPRRNVTKDLVVAWRKEMAAKESEKARKLAEKRYRKRQGSSTSVSKSRTDSKRSATTLTFSVTPRRSRRTTSAATVGRNDATSMSTIRSSPVNKRKQRIASDEDDGWSTVGEDAPRKKRKVRAEHSSRKSSLRKESIPVPPDSEEEDVDESDNEGKSGEPNFRTRREDEEKSKSNRSTPVRSPKTNGRHTDTSHKQKPKPGKATLYERNEEEEEEEQQEVEAEAEEVDNTTDIVGSFKVTEAQSREVEVVLDSRTRSSPTTTAVAPSDGPPADGPPAVGRRLDRRPTPPRRTLAKSSSGVSSQIGPKKGKRRKGPPGVRDVDIRRTERKKSVEIDDISPLLPIDGAEGRADRQRSRSLSNEPDNTVFISPSKLPQGLTARMKGRAKVRSDARGTRIDSRTASIEQENRPSQYNQFRANGKHSVAVSEPSRPDNTLTDHPMPDQPAFVGVVDDAGVVDYDVLGDPLPFSQIDEPLNAPDNSVEATAPVVSRENVFTQETGSIGSGEDHLAAPQSSEGAVIPATQSQSQPQLHSGSQDDAQDDLYLASVLAEHGSSAMSIDADLPPATFSPSITDPGPSASSNANTKVHKKIPAVTPSKFRPYLPNQRPLSAIPPPHIQGMQNIASRAENNEPTSSIESPVKDFDGDDRLLEEERDTKEIGQRAMKEKVLDDDDIEDEMPHSLELRQRGLELAEMQRKRLWEEVHEPIPRIPIDELLERTGRDSSSTSQSGHPEAGNLSVSDVEGRHSLPKGDEEPALGSGNGDDEARMLRFAEDYIDFDGNAGGSLVSERTGSPHADDPRNKSVDQENQELPVVVAEVDASEEADVESSLQDLADEDDPFLSRGNAEDREVTPSTTTSQQDDMDLPYTPVRSRFKIIGSPSKIESPVVQTPSRQLNEAMGLLHAKSEEIEYLKRQLAESENKRLEQDDALAELQAENAVIKKTLEDKAGAPKEVDEELVQQYKEREESQRKDIEAREAEIKLLKMSRDDAVKQGEIFRELYGKASSFADEKRQENAELEERARLAEGQVSIGLDLIRKQYVAQEQKLKMELERQQILTHILSTRNERTNDEVRRRAAQEPELRAHIDSLQEELLELRVAQANVVRQRNDLLIEKQELKENLDEMRAKYNKQAEDISWSQIQVARLMAREKAFKKVFLTTSTSILDNDSDRAEEKVYVCKWMSSYDGRSRCNSLFTNVQDLKDHLFVDHQL